MAISTEDINKLLENEDFMQSEKRLRSRILSYTRNELMDFIVIANRYLEFQAKKIKELTQ